MEYRNELKFELSDFDLARIKNRLLPLMRPDYHQNAAGYLVRSLYFDDLYDSCAAERENGILFREKYRIRQYNNNPDFIRLEKKGKYNDMSQKTSQSLTLQDYTCLLSGSAGCLHTMLSQNRGALLEEFLVRMLSKKFTPKCIIEYERFAFTDATGNVRITFDRNIAGSRQIENFFSPVLFTVPILPQGHHILEIKYDELLPHYIRQAIDIGNLRRQSFSKYYQTRAAIG